MSDRAHSTLHTGFRQLDRHAQTTAFAVVPRQPSTMRFHDLADQRQAQTGEVALGRIERRQGVPQHGVIHAATAIHDFDAQPSRQPGQAKADALGAGARLMRVLQQIQQRLFDLRRVDAAALFR